MQDPMNSQRPFRLLRSMLFVPATSPKFFAKAATGAADGIILDLEDAVAPHLKDEARSAAVAALNDVDWGAKTMAVRINAVETPHNHADVLALVASAPRLDLIVLPMVNTPDDVRFVATLLDQAERKLGRDKRIGIEGILETPLGLENAGAIAQASPRLEALSFGAGDYSVEMGMRSRSVGGADPDYALHDTGPDGARRTHLGDKWHYASARIANACRAYGLRPRDSAYADFKDAAGYEAACKRAVALGFEGKSAIHPAQVEIANRVFAPAPEDIAWARNLLDKLGEQLKAGHGALAIDGEMVDLANIKVAENILQKAEHMERAGS